jgi:DNA-directed RNA polymerase specialized sigma24 family protein
VSTRCAPERPAPADPAEQLASLLRDRRAPLLRAYRRWLRREDLEDCYSQATLELLVQLRRQGGQLGEEGRMSAVDAARQIERRFHARILDRRRALDGRSPTQAAHERALALSAAAPSAELADARGGVEEQVLRRQEVLDLLAAVHTLPPDQRLLVAALLSLPLGEVDFCRRVGWTRAKYRKVAQRARAQLRRLLRPEGVPATAQYGPGLL